MEKINNCGTSYIVPDLEYVTVKSLQDGRLRIVIDSDKKKHAETSARSKARDDLAERFKAMETSESASA